MYKEYAYTPPSSRDLLRETDEKLKKAEDIVKMFSLLEEILSIQEYNAR